jgi:hypothetical protein
MRIRMRIRVPNTANDARKCRNFIALHIFGNKLGIRIGSTWLHILRVTESELLPKAELRIRITFMRIRILLVIKVMRICTHWSAEPPRLDLEPSHLDYERPRPSKAPFEPSQLLNSEFNADSNPDPASKNNAVPQHWSTVRYEGGSMS